MLENVDVTQKLNKKEYAGIITDLEYKLAELQREAKELKIPVSIVFEGWDAAGKGTEINRLILALDPRGFKVYPINLPTEEERLRPFLWRFMVRTAAKGSIAIFDRSWYGRVLVEKVENFIKKEAWSKSYNEINSFERQLVDDNNVIIKFFLHITKKEQKKRFNKLADNPSTAWRVTKADWKSHKKHDIYLLAAEEMLAKTDTAYAPWTIVESHDWRFANAKIFRTVINAMENKIQQIKNKTAERKTAVQKSVKTENISSILDKVDLSVSIPREEYDKTLEKYQNRIREIEHEIYKKRLSVVIMYEGQDAAGKGGNIKRLLKMMDPRGYEVIPTAAPNDIEKSHHHLWRFWKSFPKAGHIAIFDRSWYGRVVVERVEGCCTEEEWKRAYKEINEMEEQWVNFGTALIKFWVQIDKNEQLRRFKDRQDTPHKQWKITEEDWRNRKKWNQYKAAIDEMLLRTSTSYAPWTIIESNCKLYARIKVLKTVIDEVERKLKL